MKPFSIFLFLVVSCIAQGVYAQSKATFMICEQPQESVLKPYCLENSIKCVIDNKEVEVKSFTVAFNMDNTYFSKFITGSVIPKDVREKMIATTQNEIKIFLDGIKLAGDEKTTYQTFFVLRKQ